MKKNEKIKIASILGIVGNLFLSIIKGIIGFITNSQAMIADTFNSTTDILTSLMTFIGNKIASKPRDNDHNLGHGKAEYIYSMLISVTMIFMALIIFKDSLVTLINGDTYEYSYWLVIICIITIIVKLCLFMYTNNLSKRYNNLLIKANSKDHLIDMIITFFNLISCLLAKINIYILDPIVGIGISIWIIYTAINIFMESYHVLMDKSISNDTKQKVLDIIKKYDSVKKINHFNSTPIGYLYQISFTIFVDGNLSTYESHEIADKLEKEITKSNDDIYLTVIHVNPIDIDKESNKV
ncbi:MAG: cation transporter [Bacilli bacterium]|nr:cation transporter [Bacilli bacterium]